MKLLIRFLIFVPVIIIDTIISALVVIIGGIFNPFSKFNSVILRIWARVILLAGGIKLNVSGLENIENGTSYIVIANHQSHIDIPVTISVIPLALRIIAKKELFKIPFLGWGMSAVGILKIDRSNRMQAMKTLKKAQQIMEQYKISILAFPEGTRSDDGKIHPFKSGPFKLAAITGLPILPISISGTRHVLPKKKIKLQKGKVQVIIHPAINSDDVNFKNRNALSEQAYRKILSGFEEGYH